MRADKERRAVAAHLKGSFLHRHNLSDTLRNVDVAYTRGEVTGITVKDALFFGPTREIAINPNGVVLIRSAKQTVRIIDTAKPDVLGQVLARHGNDSLLRQAPNADGQVAVTVDDALKRLARRIESSDAIAINAFNGRVY